MWHFPVPAARSRQLVDSFNRVFIPGTRRRYARGKHGAIDISWTRGSKVYLPRDATVIARGVLPGLEDLGRQVLFKYRTRSGDVRYMRLCHLDSIYWRLKVGRFRGKGSYVGRLGMTGNTSGPHVHFEWSESASWSNVSALRNPIKPLEEGRKAA